jgi:uncharacterized SAM-binding protein YcdF (DUF218 family)
VVYSIGGIIVSIISDITNFIFIEHHPKEVDIIFIAGTSYPQPPEKASELWINGYAPFILPAGKYGIKKGYFSLSKTISEVYSGEYNTEWDFMSDVLMKSGVDSNAILKENCSENTFENAFNSHKVTDENNLNIKNAIICCQAFHARRCLMYYQWAFPETQFLVCPIETQGINKDNWFKTSYGSERVMGELMRCGAQFKDAIPTYVNKKIF